MRSKIVIYENDNHVFVWNVYSFYDQLNYMNTNRMTFLRTVAKAFLCSDSICVFLASINY